MNKGQISQMKLVKTIAYHNPDYRRNGRIPSLGKTALNIKNRTEDIDFYIFSSALVLMFQLLGFFLYWYLVIWEFYQHR